MIIGLIVLVVWALLFMVVLAVCRASGRADDLEARLRAQREAQFSRGPVSGPGAGAEREGARAGGLTERPADPVAAGGPAASRRTGRFRPARVPTRAAGG